MWTLPIMAQGIVRMNMTGNKKRGSGREYAYIAKLREAEYWAIRASRSAGLGISETEFKRKFPHIYAKKNKTVRPIDVIAVSKGGILSFHQVSKRMKDISEDEIEVLLDEAKTAHAMPVLAWIEKRRWKQVFVEKDKTKDEMTPIPLFAVKI